MTAPPNLNDLKLSVTNLGPIARADIDLRPMTVFVGPSNTGKSYMAMLVYALHGFFSGRWLGPGQHLGTVFNLRGSAHEENGPSVSQEDAETLIKWMTQTIRDTAGAASREVNLVFLPEPTANLVRPKLKNISQLGNFLDREVGALLWSGSHPEPSS